MKKILSLLLALILVGSMTVSASGAEFQVGVSEKVIGAGEEVTVTITLDETLVPVETVGFRNIQGQLIYDPEILNYVSHEMAEAYRHYSSKDMPARQYFTFSYTAFNEEGFTEIPAGTVVTIVFRAAEQIEVSHLAASLSLELKTNELGKDAVWYQNGASVVICREHTWDAGEVTMDPTCTEAGEQVFTCTYEGCGATKTEPVAALGHSYENGICTVCAAVTGVAHNTSTDTSYATVAEALDAALEGQNIILLTDCADGNLMVTPGITLDLNGFDLTASYVVAFDSAQIIDSVGAGSLITSQKNLVLQAGNTMVPVYNGSGYVFSKFGFAVRQDTAHTGDGIKINAMAYPVNMDVMELLKDGGADNNVQIVIRLSWDTADGTGSQEFAFTDRVIGDVYSSNQGAWNKYSKMFGMLITGFENITNLKANIVVVSGTGVEYVSSTSLSIT